MSSSAKGKNSLPGKRTVWKAPEGGGFFSRLRAFSGEHPLSVLAGIAFAGTLFRLLVSFQLLKNDPATFSPMKESDMATYISLADGILHGVFPETFYYQPFYYSVFLPLCRLFGPSFAPGVTAIIQSLLGGAIIILTGKIALRIAGIRAGILAALSAAFSAILIYFTPYALLEILQAFFLLLLFDLTVAALGRPDWKKWALSGAVLGCSMLTRGNTLFLLPVILCALFLRKGEAFPWKKKFLYAGILLLFAILPQIPFAAYNTAKTHHLSGPSTAGGAVLALGNNPEAAPAGLEIPHTPSCQEWMKKEKSVSVPRRILRYAMEEPGAWIERKAKQFLLFWSREDHPNNISEEYNAAKSSLMRSLRFLPTGVIVSLALAGLFAGFYRKYFFRRKEFLLLAAFLLLYALSVTAFYILARFRLPALPLLCVAAGVFPARLTKFHTMQGLLRLLLCLAAGVFVCYGAYPLYSFVYEPLLMKKLQPCGVVVELEDPDFPGAAFEKWNLSLMDASSMFQGGWGMMELKEGMVVTKEFLLKKEKAERVKDLSHASLVLPVSGGGAFSVEVNGKTVRFPELPSKISVLNLGIANIPVVSDRKENGDILLRFTLRFTGIRGEIMIHFDSRRDYGRSFLSGKVVPCELALRLLLPLTEPSSPR